LEGNDALVDKGEGHARSTQERRVEEFKLFLRPFSFRVFLSFFYCGRKIRSHAWPIATLIIM